MALDERAAAVKAEKPGTILYSINRPAPAPPLGPAPDYVAYGMQSDPIEQVALDSTEDFILQFALRTARAEIIDYTIVGLDLRGPAMTQIIGRRTWGRVTYRDCLLDDAAVRQITGTGGAVESSDLLSTDG